MINESKEEFIQRYTNYKDTDKMAKFYQTSTVEIRKYAEEIGFDIKSIGVNKLSNLDKKDILLSYNLETSTNLC